MEDRIIKEKLLHHPIDRVWRAISDGDEISQWFLPCDFKAEKGYHYEFKSTAKDCSPIKGEVKRATPYVLIYTWVVTENPVETLVTWKLEQTATGTKLYLEHSGISNYQGDTAIAMFDSFSGGWNNCILGLDSYLKKMIYAE